ncbi:hypothetical protein V2J09_020226 [Rumex salicifolius]
MSSDFFMFDEPIYNYQQNSNPISMLNSDTLFHSDSSIDSFLQEISEDPITISPAEAQKKSLDEIAQTLFSDSSPTHQMENLSLYQQQQQQQSQITHLQSYPVSEIKLEESRIPVEFGSLPSSNGFFNGSHSYGGSGGQSLMIKFMERSHSYGGRYCNYDGEKQGTLFQSGFGALFESTENGFSCGQSSGLMRRVSSTGDLPSTNTTTTTFMEEANYLKVGRYNAEERKEKIDRYRAKRTQRNFNKTIKTLADSRLRVRGRFARNEETAGETAKSAAPYDDEEDDLSVDGIHEEGDHYGKMHGNCNDRGQRGEFMNHFEGYFSQFDENNFGY